MCGRFTQSKKASELMKELPGIQFDERIAPRYNIAPTQPVLAVLNLQPDQSTFVSWGLVPPWAKDPSMGARMINARSETLKEKPSFKKPYQRKRCLVPATGFYEWKAVPGERTKQPHYFRHREGRVVTFAGLWEEWHSAEGSLLMTCTLITTAANQMVRPLHDRMPVIIAPGDRKVWNDPFLDDFKQLDPLLAPRSWEDMEVFPVSRRVNKVANDDPELVEPVGVQGELF